MVCSFAKELSVGTDAIESGIANVSNRGATAIDVQSDDCRRHHGKARMFRGHLMDRAIGPLNRQLHQIFDIIAVTELMTKCLLQNVDSCLRRDLAGLRAADAIGDRKDVMLGIGDKRIFIHWPLLAQAAIGDGSDLDLVCGRWCAHWTASKAMGLSTGRFTRATAFASCALRCEKAISIPNMAKLVIKLNPPCLTNAKALPYTAR